MTEIPYLDEMWSVTTGCGDDQMSPGCLNCYARRMTSRNLWGYDFTPQFHADRLEQPLHWRKPRRIGVSFMGDLFHEAITDEQIWQVFTAMQAAPQHRYLLLTKRPERQAEMMRRWLCSTQPRDGWWLGVTVCNQEELYKVDVLRDTPTAVRWLSLEPLLGPLPGLDLTGIAWVVLGGETGRGSRTMEWSWALDVFDQCKMAGVPFYWKQGGDWLKRSDREVDDDTARRVFEMAATRELPAVTR